ncbi:MAG: hypothetical protein WA940_09140 [Sphingopyxis sp.]
MTPPNPSLPEPVKGQPVRVQLSRRKGWRVFSIVRGKKVEMEPFARFGEIDGNWQITGV